MKIISLTIFKILFSLIVHGQDTVNYIRTKEFNRLAITQEDFKNIVSSIEYYYKETFVDSLNKYDRPSFRCELVGKDKALLLASFSQIRNFSIKSESFTSLSLRYYWDKKPISSLIIEMSNSLRNISVAGNDEKKVEALYVDIVNQLSPKQVFLSSLDLPLILTFLSFALFSIVLNILIRSGIYVYYKKADRKIIMTFVGMLLLFLIFIIFEISPYSIKDYFPGFKLTSDNTTWWDKNQSFIGFASFIIAIVTFIYKSIYKILHNKKSA
jgi:hypothetical protein